MNLELLVNLVNTQAIQERVLGRIVRGGSNDNSQKRDA